MSESKDEYWMRQALLLAKQAEAKKEVPVGAIIVSEGEVIAQAYNSPITLNDPSAHAEVLAIRRASTFVDNYRLNNCELYVTIEPCTMCFGLMVHARIKRLVYGASEGKAGVIGSQLHLHEKDFYNHQVEVKSGVLADECADLISGFFSAKRGA